MKVFLDTNVIVSAVTTRGLCADVFRAVLADHDLVTSTKVIQEVQRILKLKFAVPDDLIAEYLELIEEDSFLAKAADLPVLTIKDKDDVEIIAAAVFAKANVFVTGDREVQGLKTYFPHFPNTISGGGGEGLGRQLYELKNLALQVVEPRMEDLDQIVALTEAMPL